MEKEPPCVDLSLLCEAIDVGIFLLDSQGHLVFMNHKGEEIVRTYGHGESGTGVDFLALIRDEDGRLAKALSSRSNDTFSQEVHGVKLKKEGAPPSIWNVTLRSLKEKGSDLLLLVFRDVTSLHRALELLRRERDFTRMVLEKTGALVVVLDKDGNIVDFNKACEDLTGYRRDEVLGRKVWDFLLVPEEKEAVKGVFNRLVAGDFPNKFENYWVTKGGERRLIAWMNNVETDENGGIAFVIGTGVDVTEARDKEKWLKHKAFHDYLTGLPNRELFLERLEMALARSRRSPEWLTGILFLDLDDFKAINDNFGHQTGDLVLIEFGRRLRASVRSNDTPARIGGDEFGVVLDGVRKREDIKVVGKRIEQVLKRPFNVGGKEIYVSASIGGVVTDGRDVAAEELIEAADRCMYSAKKGGKATSVFRIRGAEG